MTMTLIIKKKQKKIEFVSTCKISSPSLLIREFAKLIGNPVPFMEAVPYGRLFYRQLERDKIKSLQENKGNFVAKITLSDLSKKELTCWENDIMTATKSLKKQYTQIKQYTDKTIYTDASLGWGVGQFVKNLRQEACGPNMSRHYTSMLLSL